MSDRRSGHRADAAAPWPRAAMLAAAAAVAAAGVATLLLRPRGMVFDPAAVDPTGYFSPEQIERAEGFRGTQRMIGLAGAGASAVTLAVLAARPPGAARRALDRAGSRPLLGGAAVGAGLSLAITAVALPLDAWAHERARDVGLATQDWLPWLGDVAKSAGIGALLAGGGGLLAVALTRRFPRSWWAPAAVCVVALSAVFVYVTPVVLDPLFNRFTPLPKGELRSEVLRLADAAGVDVGEVYRVDASRRTTGANAYVGGLGATKRVVLYDNLIEDFSPDQVRSVVAHELGHVRGRDVPRGLLWLAIVAPFGMLLVQRLTSRMAPAREGTPSVLPALALALGIVSFGGAIAGNVLSRAVEARADAFALERTRDPAALISLQRRLSVQNVSDPDPPGLYHLLFGSHPTAVERIGSALTYAREDR